MRRSTRPSALLRLLLCLALSLAGFAAPAAARSGAGETWLVVCGADGPYRVPAPGAPERRPASSHADCTLCAAACGGCCASACIEAAPVAPSPSQAVERMARPGGEAAPFLRALVPGRSRGPPLGLSA